jgi:GNAT superfamily N-acetyltransferase
MRFTAELASLQDIAPWRDAYRQEMNCQIIHDSIHVREGWSREFALRADGVTVGYGSMAVAGPWKEQHTIYEFYVVPHRRDRAFDLFEALLSASGAVKIETQTNGVLCAIMLHAYADAVTSEAILFRDGMTTAHRPPAGCVLRRRDAEDEARIFAHHCEPVGDWLIGHDARIIAATGGILYHYNRPYGDIYMEVAEPFRRRGIGAFLLQELKRICYEGGSVPAARTGLDNVASRRTLQKAGFVPCGHLVSGVVKRREGGS